MKQTIFIEIGQGSLKLLDGVGGLDIPLDRASNGQLTPLCKERVTASLRDHVRRRGGRGIPKALCAISARGVSWRRLQLPASAKDEDLHDLLALQIEGEFPLAPGELAWGFRPAAANGAAGARELMVAAVKRQTLDEYSGVLTASGLAPAFTLGALVRHWIAPRARGSWAILDIGRTHSELAWFDGDVPGSVRVLAWGGEQITEAIAKRLGTSHDEAERAKLVFALDPSATECRQEITAAIREAAEPLAASIKQSWTGGSLYLSGRTSALSELPRALSELLGVSVEPEPAEAVREPGCSSATVGLQKLSERNAPMLILNGAATARDQAQAEQRASPWKWAVLAVALAAGAVLMRYAEPLVKGPGLSRKVAEIQAAQAALPDVERELGFLEHLEKSQPPYLEALNILAASSASGSRFDSLSINRRGDLSLRGTMANAQQATELRSKLISSGLFSSVVVEEQTPTPDRQKITVRITARWNAVRDPTAPAEPESKPAGAPVTPPTS